MGLVKAYVPVDVPRVSVDGWIDAQGHAHPIALSDNVYMPDHPEQFDHQMFPSHLDAQTQQACWDLWRAIAQHLARDYDLRDQCFDVEMFAIPATSEAPARAHVMEINARLHPNITPALMRCVPGINPLTAHDMAEFPTPEFQGAGGMFYVWTPGPQPRWGALADDPHRLVCPFPQAGPEHQGQTCWGWLYQFAQTPAQVLKLGRQATCALTAHFA